MRRPRQRAPRGWRDKPLYFADDSADFRFVDHDNDNAVPLDPQNCAFARCWHRLGHPAEVFRTYTYVDYGEYVVKYVTTKLMQRQLTANDQGGKIAEGDYRLGRIPPSMRKPRTQGQNRGSGGGNKSGALGPDLVRRRAAA